MTDVSPLQKQSRLLESGQKAGGFTQPSYVLEARLLFTDPEHLGAANRAGALGRRLTILHGNAPGVLDLSLGPALNTISLHRSPPFFD